MDTYPNRGGEASRISPKTIEKDPQHYTGVFFLKTVYPLLVEKEVSIPPYTLNHGAHFYLSLVSIS